MKITIDQELCIGCGCCEFMAPTVFVVNSSGKAVVIGKVPDSDRKGVLEAAEHCPAQAITVEE